MALSKKLISPRPKSKATSSRVLVNPSPFWSRLRFSSAIPYQLMQTSWPRIAIVTPVYNSVKYIEQTILSVLSQNYPNLEYFIVDGGSTDGTLDIIRKYEPQLSGWLSEPDKGMYDALNKGFTRTTGEIMGWISATDQYHLGGLSVVGSVFRDLPQVAWITGRATGFSEDGMTSSFSIFHTGRATASSPAPI